MTLGSIHQLIYPKKRKVILQVYLINVNVVDANPLFAIDIFDQNDISKLVWVLHFPYESDLQEIVYL